MTMRLGNVPRDAMSSTLRNLSSEYTIRRTTEGGSDPLGGTTDGEVIEHTESLYLATPEPEVEQTDSGELISDTVVFRGQMDVDVQKDDVIEYQSTEYQVDTVTALPTDHPTEKKIVAIRQL